MIAVDAFSFLSEFGSASRVCGSSEIIIGRLASARGLLLDLLEIIMKGCMSEVAGRVGLGFGARLRC